MAHRTIFGIPPSNQTEAGRAVSHRHSAESPRYMPESRLTDQQINGVGEDGDCWAPWRIDGDGQQWFARTSSHGVELEAVIHGVAAGDDDLADDIEADGEGQTVEDLQRAFHRNVEILQSRFQRGDTNRGDNDGLQ